MNIRPDSSVSFRGIATLLIARLAVSISDQKIFLVYVISTYMLDV